MASPRRRPARDEGTDNRALQLLDAIHAAFRDVSEEEILADFFADERDERARVKQHFHTSKPGSSGAPRDAV